jgi:hypothetical protein
MNTNNTMKTQIKLATLALLSTFNLQTSPLLAQGDLTPPPGVPMPTMKTLAQIESRTAIDGSTTPVVLSQPGSYYLTTNLTVASGNAISIAANGVTLDLNGFTLSSTAASASAYGIQISGGLQDITISNGHIRGGVTNSSGVYAGSGFQYGISYTAAAPRNVRAVGISVSGCLTSGIDLGPGGATVVESCTVRTVGGNGIQADLIRASVAVDCGNTALSGNHVSDSRGESTGSGSGISAFTVQNSQGSSSSGYGIYAIRSALNCHGISTSSHGIHAISAQNCYGITTSGTFGLRAESAQNCYGNNTSGTYGLYASNAQNCMGHCGVGGSYGLNALIAQGCHGYADGSGTGLHAGEVAIGCCGDSASGVGLHAFIANSCYVSHGTTSITHKFNMP